MFLRNIELVEINRLKKRTETDNSATKFLHDLKDGLYDIYFSYNPGNQKILYEALPVVPELSYIGFYVSSSKKIEDIYGRETSFADAFALFIYERDINKDEDGLKETYGPLYDELSPLASLSRNDAMEREEQLPLFEEFAKALLEDEPVVKRSEPMSDHSDNRLKVTYLIKEDGYSDDEFIIKVKAGYDKPLSVKDSFDFIRKAAFGGEIELSKKVISIKPSSLSDSDTQACSFLLSKGLPALKAFYALDRKSVVLPQKEIVPFIFVLRGRKVNFKDYDVLVMPDIVTPSISMDGKGRIHLNPDLEGELYFHGLDAISISYRNNTIIPLTFASSKEAKIYQFVSEYPDFRFDLFQNEMASGIVPLIEDKVQVSEEYKERHPYRRDEIRYYIDYEKNDTLDVKTQYFFDKDEVNEETFINKPINAKKNNDFHAAITELGLPVKGTVSDGDVILNFLKADLSALQQAASVYLSDNISKKKVSTVGKINIRTSSGIDWLEVTMSSNQFTDDELSQILAAYKKKKKFIKLKDTFIDLMDSRNDDFGEFINDFDIDDITSKKLPLYQVLKLQSYQGNDFDVAYSDEVKKMLVDIKNFKNHPINLESDILKNMRPYQIDGVKWLSVLVQHRLSGILADDMGLGKTFEMIALLSQDKTQMPILVVSPKSLIYNWENEFHKWTPFQKVHVLDGDKASRQTMISEISPNQKEVYITSYDSLRNDLSSFDKITFSYLILDEGQNISNVYAKKTRAVKKINAANHFVLTGTPIQNSLMDLWSIFDFLMPGYLDSYQDFHRSYGKITLEDEGKRESLMMKVTPFVLKRTKTEVLADLPPKDEQIITIAMNEEQRKLYDAFLMEAKSTAFSADSNKIAILAALTRLRQICVDPAMFIDNYEADSVKLSATVKMIKDSIANGHKLLVFSAFAKTLIKFKETLKKEGLKSYLIYGQTDAKERLKMAKDFNTKDDVKVMLVSLKAGGTGLNLIGADIVIHLDPWWNLAAENQASDRAHRLGQTRSVTIIKLVCKDSIEEKVIELQNKKKDLSKIIQEGDEGITNLDTEDLKFLLS